MKYVTGFFRFWYDFIVGDSWQIAAGVILVVAAARVLIAAQPQLASVAAPVYLLAFLAVFCGVILSEFDRPGARH